MTPVKGQADLQLYGLEGVPSLTLQALLFGEENTRETTKTATLSAGNSLINLVRRRLLN